MKPTLKSETTGTKPESEIMMLLRQLSYAIKNQLKAPKGALGRNISTSLNYFLPFTGSLWHKGAFSAWREHSISTISTNVSAPLWTKLYSDLVAGD